MLKKVVLMAALALALPVAAFASGGVDFTNSGGTLTGSSSGLALNGSVLIGVNGFAGAPLVTGAGLGSLSFTTGALLSGSLQGNATLAGGGSFTIIGNGINGLPNGTIFSGSFTGPVEWTVVTLANGTHNYTLTGAISGTFNNNWKTEGVTIQLTINTGKGPFNGRAVAGSSGDTNILVPEPGTLSLFGTGILGLAGLVRRKLGVA